MRQTKNILIYNHHLLLDSPYIRMIKFHDVRLQNGLDLDPLWCHEGMQHIAKKLPWLHSDKLQIFLGQLEKVKVACCGKYLEESGINIIFAELEIFGPEVVTLVMGGGKYILGKRGTALISAAL